MTAISQVSSSAIAQPSRTGMDALGLYVSVPFCRSKCSYCNFASGVFSPALYDEYSTLLRREIERACAEHGVAGAAVDSVYWGGGTPSLLPSDAIRRLAAALRERFTIAADAEFTVEAAPGTLNDAVIEALLDSGVNRVSLGVQSFVDQEARSVARLHTRDIVLDDITRLRARGISNLNLDLIAGLPYQTRDSWEASLAVAGSTGVPHVSVYMLEVDEESRLGGELLAGGTRYHAHHVPDNDLIADFYERACERLAAHGLPQYEVSNFAVPGAESRHNERYWLRRPYLGFGVDAHSMLDGDAPRRWANCDSLDLYLERLRGGQTPVIDDKRITPAEALEESLFLGLRRNCGVDLDALARRFGKSALAAVETAVADLVQLGLLERSGRRFWLSARGRLLANEVCARFIGLAA